ncbi:GH12653 [Drosophila grimshawi]|uniref:GH12653 n=1 Tax=Drosophila grimshawi TaxID=7222 RepID=B4JKG5_DROGR|nr:GH12653 [Drosophila grimshawi]
MHMQPLTRTPSPSPSPPPPPPPQLKQQPNTRAQHTIRDLQLQPMLNRSSASMRACVRLCAMLCGERYAVRARVHASVRQCVRCFAFGLSIRGCLSHSTTKRHLRVQHTSCRMSARIVEVPTRD